MLEVRCLTWWRRFVWYIPWNDLRIGAFWVGLVGHCRRRPIGTRMILSLKHQAGLNSCSPWRVQLALSVCGRIFELVSCLLPLQCLAAARASNHVDDIGESCTRINAEEKGSVWSDKSIWQEVHQNSIRTGSWERPSLSHALKKPLPKR